ncbi:MAG TPA: serine hydrolase domain-containing protein [Blastocatellia bacterium]
MRLLIVSLLLLACPLSTKARFEIGNSRPAQDAEIGQRIRELLESARKNNDLPGMAGAVLTSKGLVGIGATGVRKRATQVQVTVDDEWHLGSDTKAMTATVIAKLIEQGKLKWDTTIGEALPDKASGWPADFSHITMIELLSHHAGLPANINWHMPAFSGPMIQQRKRVVEEASKLTLLSKPGTEFSYSNLGYVVAAAIAENITGRAWEEMVTDIVFKPLGMTSVGFGGTGTPGKVDQPWPHRADGTPAPMNGPSVDNPPVMGPAGCVHCTLQDWAKFIADQLSGELGSGALLKPETYKKLHEPPFGGDYALGWIITQRPWGGGTIFTHAGSNTMNYAVVWIAPKRDFAVLVTSNQGGPAATKGCDEAAGSLIRLYTKQ